ncbi:MAG TPA: glycosyltransferase family 87 protein [Candidatus Acidoferrales bacterium]|nr:glycosyltransferase family 87 protein [Candidatus Acidoferrales bacterium]
MILLWLIAGFWASAIFGNAHARVNKWDFSHYYLSAMALRSGPNPYTSDLAPMGESLGLQVDEINRATYPPTFLLCFEPLTLLRPVPAYWTWFGLNVLAVALAFVLLLQNGSLDFARAMSFVALAVLYPPVMDHFKFAQSQIAVLLCLVLMMSSLRRGDQALAGLLLAFATMLRVYPIVMVGYLIVERKWLALRWMTIGIAVIGTITLAFVGWTVSLSFLGLFGFLTSKHWYEPTGNISISATTSRIFWYTLGVSLSPGLDLLRRVSGIAAEFAVLAITARVTFSRAQIQKGLDSRVFALWIAGTIMLAPTAWFHYLVLLFIPYALIASAAYESAASRLTVWMAVSSYAIIFVDMLVLPAIDPHSTSWLAILLRERAIVSLGMAYVAAYWFVSDGPELWTVALEATRQRIDA